MNLSALSLDTFVMSDNSMQPAGSLSNGQSQKYIVLAVKDESSSGTEESDSVLAIQKLIQEQKGTVMLCSVPAAQVMEKKEENETSIKSKVPDGFISRESSLGKILDDQALQIIERIVDLNWENQKEDIELPNGFGRILASRVSSEIDIPAYDEAMYNGYAVKSAEKNEDRLVINTKIDPLFDECDLPTLKDLECARVTEGAPIPPGADAVIKEYICFRVALKSDERSYHSKIRTILESDIVEGVGIRERGSMVKVDDIEGGEGERLTVTNLGRLAAIGTAEITVFKKPTIALLSVGNRLVANARVKTENTKIVYDSSRIVVKSIIRKRGFEVTDLGIVTNEPTNLMEKLSFGLSKADVFIVTSNILMGEIDYLKPVLKIDFCATIQFSGVKMIPRNPLTFATLQWEGRTKFVFILPSSMPAAIISTTWFIIPALQKMEGGSFNHASKKNILVEFKEWEDSPLANVPQYFWGATIGKEQKLTVYKDESEAERLIELQPYAVLVRIPPKGKKAKTDREFEVPGITLEGFL